MAETAQEIRTLKGAYNQLEENLNRLKNIVGQSENMVEKFNRTLHEIKEIPKPDDEIKSTESESLDWVDMFYDLGSDLLSECMKLEAHIQRIIDKIE